jgi:ATP/maltotriose-dependent transcriptional regulator MalT
MEAIFTYEVIEEEHSSIVKRTDENGNVAWIPMDESNSDYQRYLNPEAEQSTPSLADEAKAK